MNYVIFTIGFFTGGLAVYLILKSQRKKRDEHLVRAAFSYMEPRLELSHVSTAAKAFVEIFHEEESSK